MTFHATPPPDSHAWRATAPCKAIPVDQFFTLRRGGVGGSGADVYQPEVVACCARCPHRAPCLADALDAPAEWDKGFRAGCTEAERLKIRNARRKMTA